MIIFEIMYPYAKNRDFDMEYYLGTHIVQAVRIFGDACKKVEVAKGFKEFYPDTTPFYAVVARLYFESEASFFEVYTEEADLFLMEDIPRFTEIMPVWQLEEIVYSEG